MKATRSKARKSASRKSVPKAISEFDVKGAVKVFDKLMAEKKPAVPKGFAEALESSITGSGADAINRRLATAMLSRPFKVTAKAIRGDRETAIAFADAGVCIKSSVQKYKSLADLMETAEVRIQLALCQRADMEEITSLAKADAPQPARD